MERTWRWPWVARELVESERAATDRLVAHFQKENERLAALVEALRGELAAVTLRATTPAPVATVNYEAPVREPDPDGDVIRAAIRDESAGDPRLAAYLRKRASELAARGDKTPRQIADELRTWETVGDPFDSLIDGVN